jgi:hypothetical protein
VSQKCEFEFSRILNLCGFLARAELVVSLKAPLHQTGAILKVHPTMGRMRWVFIARSVADCI